MGLREVIARSVEAARSAFHPEPEHDSTTPTDLHLELRQQFARLQGLLEESRRASREKDELIAKLQAGGAANKDTILDGAACFIRRDEDVLDGPFCLHCFESKEHVVRLVPVPRPKGEKGHPSEWIQCPECQMPFRSRRVGEYLRIQSSKSGCTEASSQEGQSAKTRDTTSNAPTRSCGRRKKKQQDS